jgi:hypothetical protein
MLTSGNVQVLQTLVLTMLIVISVLAAGNSGQERMFSAGDAYERFMGKWSRELASLLAKFAEVRDGDAVLYWTSDRERER